MKLLQESLEKKYIPPPYVHFSCLDATGISDRKPEQEQILHWGPNGICSIAIGNQVYLVQPIIESATEVITPCIVPYYITCLRWLDSLAPEQDRTKVSVLAIATNCPQGRLQIWECQRKVLLRVVNKSQEIFSSLAWNQSFLVGSTL